MDTGDLVFLGRGAVFGGVGLQLVDRIDEELLPPTAEAVYVLKFGGGVMHLRDDPSIMAVTRLLIGVLLLCF